MMDKSIVPNMKIIGCLQPYFENSTVPSCHTCLHLF
jgi:hypothetical protein